MNTELAKDLEPEVPAEEVAAAEAETPNAEKVEAPKQEVKETKEEPKEEDGAIKFVPHGALHEERQKRKQLQAELQETQRRQALLEGRLQQIFAAQQQPQEQIDPNDPLAVLAHGQQVTQRQLAELQQRQHHEEQVRMAHARRGQMVNWYQQQAAEFEKATPDFREAYQHMHGIRVAQIRAVVGDNPQAIREALENDEMMVVHNAAQTGQNPAEIIYRMAQNTGWKKQGVAPEKKMEALQKGVEASKSLGNGGQSSGWPTPDQIATMPEHEFEELKAKLKKSGKRISDLM